MTRAAVCATVSCGGFPIPRIVIRHKESLLHSNHNALRMRKTMDSNMLLRYLGRAAALALGLVCLYIAFFMYEDANGKWQNRLDDLWIAIYDRSKVTQSTTTALLNKVAQSIGRFLDSLFGVKLVSLRMIAMSLNLALAGAALIFLLIGPFAGTEDIEYLVIILVLFLSGGAIWVAMRYSGPWVNIAGILIPVLLIAAAEIVDLVSANVPANGNRLTASGSGVFLVSALLSVGSDILSVAVIRWMLRKVSQVPSLTRMAFAIIVLAVTMAVLEALPVGVFFQFVDATQNRLSERIADVAAALALMNISTVIYCIFPVACLVFVVLHRVIWPFLSHAIYPLCQFKIVANRKLLVPVGCAGLAVAFGLERPTLRMLFNLLH